ncbi:unnamed protein product [Durusdinium trenchii]|uniref:Uncharacterized protein n=2 Tax=Durusdinium trenchii TaxID=1381693 RepID=A0ABP0IV27_9DINO
MTKVDVDKPSAIRPLHDEVASRYKELVRREQALAAREKLAAEVCQAQEEREQDLEEFAVRLQQQEEALRKLEVQVAKEKQEAARESLVAKPGEGRQTHEETAGLRLSERAGRVANREKRLAEDEAALLRRENRIAEKEKRMEGRERDVMEAEGRNMRELAARRRQAELRELRVADLESRLAEAWRFRSMPKPGQEAVLQGSPLTSSITPTSRRTLACEMSMAGPGEELTQTLPKMPSQEEGHRVNPKVVRFVEQRASALAPPASWERPPNADPDEHTPQNGGAGRPRLTARKRVAVEVKPEEPKDEKWYSSTLRRLTRCGS